MGQDKVFVKKHRWYLGGIASGMAVCVTHPLDLLKVNFENSFVMESRAVYILNIPRSIRCSKFYKILEVVAFSNS